MMRRTKQLVMRSDKLQGSIPEGNGKGKGKKNPCTDLLQARRVPGG